LSRDLQLSPSMVTFENLDDLLGAIDESIDIHTRAIERYSDLLGGILRETIGNAPPQPIQEEHQKPPEQKKSGGGFGLFSKSQATSDNKKVARNKLEEEQKGWTVLDYQDFSLKIATGQPAQVIAKRTESLFKIVEALKSKVSTLQTARKFLAELPSRGLRSNQVLSVVFKDGIPRQILPATESKDRRARFAFGAEFAIEPMRVR
jgi:hypothetical protein